MNDLKKIWVVTGPTAVGKTNLTVQLAKKLGAPIVSCDSRQFYKELSIGTAKPTPEEMDGVPHYFIDSHSLNEPLTAGTYETEAVELIDELLTQFPTVIVTGGSGLYLQALLFGIEEKPEVPESISKTLQLRFEQEGLEELAEELKELDPVYYEQADVQNSRRVIRALEVIKATGKPFSSFQKGEPKARNWEADIFILNREREELYNRINQRIDIMMHDGLLQEVESVLPYRKLPVMNTVGYQEFFDYFDDNTDLGTCVELVKRNSRRYAKRQLTWFRRLENANWIHPEEFYTKFIV